MKLSEWAGGQGVSFRTALNWFLAGTLPVSARQLPTGTNVVESSAEPSGRTVAYCRVSSADRRDDVERQAPGAGHDPRSRASMCAGLYGRRSARRRAEAGLRCATAEVVEVIAE